MIRDNLKIDALKEPRGFIRVLQFVLAILAFATTTSLSTSSEIRYHCKNDNSDTVARVKISYPFDLTTNSWPLTPCYANDTRQGGPFGNFSGASQFYVFVGVMAFLISLGSVIVYTFLSDRYEENRRFPLIDLIVTAIWCLLWLIASSAWADKFTKLRHYSDPDVISGNPKHFNCVGHCEITGKAEGNFAKLYVSMIFGFLNVFVWGFNCWFLYKETSFFAGTAAPPPPPTEQKTQPPTDPYPQQFPQGSM